MTATSALSKIAVLDMDIRSGEGSDYSRRVDRVDCYAIGSIDLARYAALIIMPNADQEHLARRQRVIRDYLDRGGVVVRPLDDSSMLSCPGPPRCPRRWQPLVHPGAISASP